MHVGGAGDQAEFDPHVAVVEPASTNPISQEYATTVLVTPDVNGAKKPLMRPFLGTASSTHGEATQIGAADDHSLLAFSRPLEGTNEPE